MELALAVRRRANCRGSRVGAILVRDGRIVATGYNGTPSGMMNCDDGGCDRCLNRDRRFPSGTGYDVCVCVHAEQNCLLSAARFGTAVEGGVVYTTMRPCFGCTKELLQAKVRAVVFLHDWRHPDEGLQRQYELIQARFPDGMRRVVVPDPEASRAVRAGVVEESGHVEPGRDA